ncbi:MAG TPA: hypothetical protein VMM12_14700 [Longimicrobiales bacterium]|nr:hypothetical protein [Longimicrobiales bacterium]
MRGARASRAGLVAAALLAGVLPVAAQEECAATGSAGVALSGAALRSDLAGGDAAEGIELGVEGRLAGGGFTLSAGLQHATFDGAAARPLSGRLRITRPVARLLGVTFCAAGLMGGASVAAGEDEAWTVAGGLAVVGARQVPTGGFVLVPYVGVRGLGARSTGNILGQDFAATGAALGVEAGVGLARERIAGALRFSADGLDPGLGPMPYPSLALRLVAGWRL